MRHSKRRLAVDIGCALLASGAIGLSCPAFAADGSSDSHTGSNPPQSTNVDSGTDDQKIRNRTPARATPRSFPPWW